MEWADSFDNVWFNARCEIARSSQWPCCYQDLRMDLDTVGPRVLGLRYRVEIWSRSANNSSEYAWTASLSSKYCNTTHWILSCYGLHWMENEIREWKGVFCKEYEKRARSSCQKLAWEKSTGHFINVGILFSVCFRGISVDAYFMQASQRINLTRASERRWHR